MVALVPWQQSAGWPAPGFPQGMAELFDQVDQMFRQAWGLAAPGGAWPLQVQMEETGEELVVRIPLHGAEPSQLEVRLGETMLSLRSRTAHEVRREVDGGTQTAASYARWATSVALPVPVDPSRSRAAVQGGVLEVRVSKRGPLAVEWQ